MEEEVLVFVGEPWDPVMGVPPSPLPHGGENAKLSQAFVGRPHDPLMGRARPFASWRERLKVCVSKSARNAQTVAVAV